MLSYRYPLVAREGWLWVGVAAIIAIAGYVMFAWLSLPLWLLVLLLLFLYRDPARVVPASPLGVVSPVDGEVIRVETVRDDYCDRQAICISIRMTITSIYSMRSPMEGKVMQQWHAEPLKIQFQDGSHDHRNRRVFAMWTQSDEADDLVLVVEQGLLSSRPLCYAHSGERIGQGQRCGFIRFGATVHVLLPESTRVGVKVEDQVQAACDIIATLVHTEVSATETAEA